MRRISTVSYTHLDVYKRQNARGVPIWAIRSPGRWMGPILTSDVYKRQEYARIRTEYRTDAWLYRTVTTKELTGERKPELGPASEIAPGDSVAEAQAALYYVSVDTKGEIGWAAGTFRKAGCPCN